MVAHDLFTHCGFSPPTLENVVKKDSVDWSFEVKEDATTVTRKDACVQLLRKRLFVSDASEQWEAHLDLAGTLL